MLTSYEFSPGLIELIYNWIKLNLKLDGYDDGSKFKVQPQIGSWQW